MLYTIGHSTRPIDDFIELLQAHRVKLLVDVRTVPHSRHNPQFDQAALRASLESVGIGYRHQKDLGGLRKPKPDSRNAAWRNLSFRGYADYMETAAFQAALAQTLDWAAHERIALMCAEGAPFRCHRSLIADAVIARGGASYEISSARSARPHRLTPFARVDASGLHYPDLTTNAVGEQEVHRER